MANKINIKSMLKTGTVLNGTYQIDGYLSSGGFGNTYKASHTKLGTTWAIKEFFLNGVSERENNSCNVKVSNLDKQNEFNQQRDKFYKEAQRLHQLKNPHIIKVHDLFDDNNTSYYVMDYIDGMNLKEYLEEIKKPLSEEKTINILDQVLDALEAAHGADITHMDLKPANIMIDKKGTVTLIDFGASKQFTKNGVLSQTAITYTPGYAPIEQTCHSYNKLGPWTDFYALGATLFNLLTNTLPPMPDDIMDDHSSDKHLALKMPGVSKKVRSLVVWCMDHDRSRRPQSVKEIRAFLNKDSEEKQPKKKKDDDGTIHDKPKPPVGGDKSKPWYKQGWPWITAAAMLVGGAGTYGVLSNQGVTPLDEIEVAEDTTAVVEEVVEEAPQWETVTDKWMTLAWGDCNYTGVVNAEGLPDGEGTATFAKGDVCQGTFVNGRINGDDITYRLKDGDVIKGKVVNDTLVRGRYTVKSSGSYFEGTFKDGSPDKGQWYDKHGKKL